MQPTVSCLALFLSIASEDPPVPAKKEEKTVDERLDALEKSAQAPDLFKVQWKDGLRLTTNDGRVDLKIGGRVQFDGEWNKADDDLEASRRYSGDSGDAGTTAGVGPLEDGWQNRRARLQVQGTAYEHVDFKLQFGFEKGGTSAKDVYAGLFNLGDWIPNLRAGHQFEPFGLETITSSNDSTFIERSLISNTFGPQRNPGFLLYKNWKVEGEERLTWAAGVFREDTSDNAVATGDGAYAVTARVTGTPVWEEKGKRMLHLGLAASRRAVGGRGTEGVTYASKPEADLLNVFLSTGAMREADVDWRYGAEAAWFWNALSLQGEYILTKTDMTNGSALDDASFHGWYAQVAYTLTGENRRWKPAEATFQNPKPAANAFDKGGLGAWEVAFRYSAIDLTDGDKATGGVEGGQLDIVTVGLNWYLNPNTKVMWDVSRADLDVDDAALGQGGDATIAQMRVQFAF